MLKDNKIVNNYGGIYFVYVRSFREDCWEEYEEPVLDDAEKKYLSAVIKPFRDRVVYIRKVGDVGPIQFISIRLKRYDYAKEAAYEYFDLPYFKKDTMYIGMEVKKEYTLKELGL